MLNGAGTDLVSAHRASHFMPQRNFLQNQIRVGRLNLTAGECSGCHAQKGVLLHTQLPTHTQNSSEPQLLFQVLFSRRYVNRYINRQHCMIFCILFPTFWLDTNSAFLCDKLDMELIIQIHVE